MHFASYHFYLVSEGRFLDTEKLFCLSSSVQVLPLDVTKPRDSHTWNYRELATSPVSKCSVEKLVIEGKIEGKKQRGRQKLAFLDGTALGAGCYVMEMLRQAGNRTGCRIMTANVRP